jgi:hypothetical protein
MMSARTSKRFVALVLPALLASGCAHYPVNAPPAAVDSRNGYRFQNPSYRTKYWSSRKAK